MKKGLLVLGVMVCSLASLFANGASEGTKNKTTVRIASGPIGGVNNTIASGIASELMKSNPDYLVSAEVTTGGQENLRMVGAGEADFGIAGPDMVYYANKNEREFSGAFNENDKFTMVCTGWGTVGFIMVPKNSKIQSVTDLKGKKVGVGSGSVLQNFWPMILEAYGMKLDDMNIASLTLSDICDGLQDNTIDAGVFCTSPQNSTILQLFTVKDMKLIALSKKVADSIVKKYPFQIVNYVPGGIYKGVDEPVLNIGGTSQIFCSKNVPDEVVYNFTKLLFEKNAELTMIHPNAAALNKENALISSDIIPVHPGALKYYKEISIAK